MKTYKLPSLHEDIRIVQDRLNANKSRLTQETRVKLTKTLNQEYIKELENLVKKDQEKIEIWKNLQKDT